MMKIWISPLTYKKSSVMASQRIGGMTFILAAICFSLLFTIESQAQERRTVTGTVTDAQDKSTLPAVNVLVKGTSIGTTTNAEGQYEIRVPSDRDTLLFSFLGYLAEEVEIEGRSVVDISLFPDIKLLDDVVVVGYGTQEKKEITSSITAVSEREFNRGNVNSPAELLQGKVPGLSIYNKGNDPNSTPTIRLRGISTVGANTEPLVVVDGVIGASLSNVDPNDIASINVLKDGSAAAIYGTRASSGVILVTTKQGSYASGTEAGENVQLDYNGYVAAAMVANNQPVMNAEEYKAAGGNDLGGNTDWQDLVTRTGISNVHNISIAGGSENTTYRISTNVRDVKGILEKSGFNQINGRANIRHTAFDDKLNLTLNISATKRENDFSFNEALRYATLYNPTAPVRFDNGEYFQAVLFDNFNPVAIVNQNINEGESKNLNFNAQAEYALLEQLSLTASYGQQYDSRTDGEFYPNTSFFRGLNRNGLARREFEDHTFTLFETYATLRNGFDKMELTSNIGYSFQEDLREGLTLELGNLPTNEGSYHIIDLSGDRVRGGTSNIFLDSFATPRDRIIAYFARVNFTFDNTFFVNASIRREGASKLGVDNRWGNFPALGIGADVNRYLNVDIISQLKVRLGYGVTGALPGPSGLALDRYEYEFTGPGTVSPVRDANPDLKWEEKAEINLGLDFGLLEDKLSGQLDVYNRTISDFILEVDAPTGSISPTIFDNVGELETNGLELSLNYDAIRNNDMFWNTGLVFSTYKTVLNEFITDEQSRANLGSPGQNSTPMIRVATGEEIGQIWGPVFSGDIDEDGAPIMADINGDGQLIVGQGDALADDGDFQQLGKGIPDFEIGWTNQFSYKNFELNAFFRGAFGHSLVNTFRAFYEPVDPGAINSYNRIKTDKAVEGLTVAQFSSLYVEEADFIKLDNLTLAYNFDVGKISQLRRVRAYINVQNAFTITNYSGLDPEPVLQDFGSIDNGARLGTTPDVLSPGIDRRNNYFTARTFTFGINLGF